MERINGEYQSSYHHSSGLKRVDKSARLSESVDSSFTPHFFVTGHVNYYGAAFLESSLHVERFTQWYDTVGCWSVNGSPCPLQPLESGWVPWCEQCMHWYKWSSIFPEIVFKIGIIYSFPENKFCSRRGKVKYFITLLQIIHVKYILDGLSF